MIKEHFSSNSLKSKIIRDLPCFQMEVYIRKNGLITGLFVSICLGPQWGPERQGWTPEKPLWLDIWKYGLEEY